MPGQLKEVRNRIKSVQSTQQITKAMKMVSAAKLRRAQDAIVQMRPYANRLNKMLVNILSNLEGDANTSFGVQREVKSACVVVITSNRGLCGAFNTNIIKIAAAAIQEDLADVRSKGKLSILFIGKKGYDVMKKRFPDCNLITDNIDLFADLSFDNVAKVSKKLMTNFEMQQYDRIVVAYGRFKNAATQFAELEQFLPVAKLESTTKGE